MGAHAIGVVRLLWTFEANNENQTVDAGAVLPLSFRFISIGGILAKETLHQMEPAGMQRPSDEVTLVVRLYRHQHV